MSTRPEVQAIVDAWTDEGVAPALHRQWQAKLRAEWPVLARAIEDLVDASRSG